MITYDACQFSFHFEFFLHLFYFEIFLVFCILICWAFRGDHVWQLCCACICIHFVYVKHVYVCYMIYVNVDSFICLKSPTWALIRKGVISVFPMDSVVSWQLDDQFSI